MKFILLLMLTPLLLHSQPLENELDQLLRAAFPGESAGGAVLVKSGDQIIYEGVSGMGQLQKQQALQTGSNFRMASVTKQFTAAAIALLVKSGQVSLRDSLARFFPELPEAPGRIQVEQLLNHSSGIWDYEDKIPTARQTQLSDADVLELIKGENNTYFTPGTQFRYSNTAYCLLALIVERVSGQSFAGFVRDHLLLPAGMRRSRVYEKGKRLPRRVYGYARRDDGALYFSDQSLTSATLGDGGLYTSLRDYAKWIAALEDNRFFDLTTMLLQNPNPLPAAQGGGFYHYGWFFRQLDQGRLLLFHTGSTCGFSNLVLYEPQSKTLVACFSNIAGNHRAFGPILERLQSAGLLTENIWNWHEATD